MTLDNGRLHGTEVEQFYTQNIYKPEGTQHPKLIVLHLTAGVAKNAHDWCMHRGSDSSFHLLVLNDGTVRQYAGFHQKCMHVGVGWHPAHGWWPNNWSVGIEFENPGPMTLTSEGPKTWRGDIHKGGGVFHGSGTFDKDGPLRGWVQITQPQYAAGIEICKLLIGSETCESDIVGHDFLSSTAIRALAVEQKVWHSLREGKLDPGPAINMEYFINEVGS